MEYHGYWFYDLQANKIIQAKDLLEEYCLLNCLQSVNGPFKDKIDVEKYVEQTVLKLLAKKQNDGQ